MIRAFYYLDKAAQSMDKRAKAEKRPNHVIIQILILSDAVRIK